MSEKCRKILASVGAVVLIVLISIAIADIHKKGVYDSTMELNYGWTLIFHGDTAKIESTGNYQFAKKNRQRGFADFKTETHFEFSGQPYTSLQDLSLLRRSVS